MRVALLGVCIGLALQCSAGWAGQPGESLLVGPLSRALDDVGCLFVLRTRGWESPAYFISGPDGAWMNIDGNDTMLSRVLGGDGYEEPWKYTYQDAKIRLETGKSKDDDVEALFEHARLIITRHGKTRVLKLKGYCGC